MTREEALIQLRLGPGINEDVSEEYNEAVDMAIKAIRMIPSEEEKVIKIKKGTLKARTGRYVIYDVEWLKEHFNTTEAKIYGQPSEHTEERTETHACDCISREAVLDSLRSWFVEGFNEDRWWNSTYVLDIINKAPSVTPQPKTEGARGDIPLQQSVPEMPQPSERTEERTETHACESKADKALNLLAEWVIECGFGYDNIPEEYEKYKDDIEDMGYREGLVYIVKMESEVK